MADWPPSTPCSTQLSPADVAAARRELSKAYTLPPSCYTSAEFYAREVEHIFMKEWLCVGRQEQVAKPGDYFTTELFGEPLVVVRDRDNQIHVLSRVCRHRSVQVVEGTGNRSSFQCPYHLWTYALSGELIGAPEMQKSDGFDKKNCRLPALRTEIWEGFIFANFDAQARPLKPSLATLQRKLAPFNLSTLKAMEPLVYDSPWNWKTMVENFIEPYHNLGAHLDTVEPMFPARLSRTDDTDGPYTILRLFPNKDQPAPPPVLPLLTDPGPAAPDDCALGGAIFPTLLIAVGPDSLLYYQLLIDSVEHFTLRMYLCLPETTLANPQFADAIAERWQEIVRIHQQDVEICRSAHQGLRARLSQPGRLCHLEKSIWQFNQYILDRVVG